MDANAIDAIMFSLRHMARCTPDGRKDATSAMMLLGCTCKTFNAKIKALNAQESRLSEYAEIEYYKRVNRAVLWNTGGLYDPEKDRRAVESHAGSGAYKWRFVRACVRLGVRPARVAEMCNQIGDVDRWTSLQDRFAMSLDLIKMSYTNKRVIESALYRRFDADRPLPRPESIADESAKVDWVSVIKHTRQFHRAESCYLCRPCPKLSEWHSKCKDIVEARIDKVERYKNARWNAFWKDANAQAELKRLIKIREILWLGYGSCG